MTPITNNFVNRFDHGSCSSNPLKNICAPPHPHRNIIISNNIIVVPETFIRRVYTACGNGKPPAFIASIEHFVIPSCNQYDCNMTHPSKFPLGSNLNVSDFEGDPYPILHRLRTAEPVSWIPALEAWLVTRYDLCIEVMRNAKTYTVNHPGFSTGQVVGPSMLSLDGDKHMRHRSPFELPFRKREVKKRFQQPVQQYIATLLDKLTAAGRAELRRDYAGPIAVQTMIAALGLNATSITAVLGWYDTIVDAVTRVTAGEPVSAEGRAAFNALRETLLPSLKQDPHSSLLAAAGGMATDLSEEQIISNAAVLLFGGIETTEGMIANAFYHLLTNPTVMAEAVANPTLIPAVVEESLRLEPAAAVVDRYATENVWLGSALIKAGDLVRVSLTAANRDPAVFPYPDQFNPRRDNLRSHVTFAQGPHVCLGLHLARLEAQEAIAQALQRLPNIQLINQEAAVPRGLVFRKPLALHTQWDTV